MNYSITVDDRTIPPTTSPNDMDLNLSKGGYILIVELDSERSIRAGSLGMNIFPEGFYAYFGSALGGFKSRINRHLLVNKKPKWHIDYLTNNARITQIIILKTERKLECILSQTLLNKLCFIPKFGSSDCHCKSHLYFTDRLSSLKENINMTLTTIMINQESFITYSNILRRS